jgi:4-hydroxyphenylpyruvate dioxygenase
VRNPLFLNTILLGGTTAAKLAAARAAAFDQVELWRGDIDASAGGVLAVATAVAAHGLGITDLQVLLDFDGAPAEARARKRSEAIAILDDASALGAPSVLVPASTDRGCDPARVADDMRWLAGEAAARGLRVAYEGMAWSTINDTLASAWELVERLDEPNVGVVVDAFHLFARGGRVAEVDRLAPERILLVQLSDLTRGADLVDVADTARHRRLLPGDGDFPLAHLVDRLRTLGYTGPIGIEVFNDELKAHRPGEVAKRAMEALQGCLEA